MCENAYTSFAKAYDLFMGDIPYGEWQRYIGGLLKDRGIENGLVLELCCGTGTFTELLAALGYDMIGVDSSSEMLEIAAQKKTASGTDILYLLQDIREFELYGTVRAIVCVCDSLNYMVQEEDLRAVFSLVNNYLDPGGVFIFDMKTVYYMEQVMGDSVAVRHLEEGTLIWENNYFPEDQTNEYELTFFLRGPDGRYARQQETHLQRAYKTEDIRRLLLEAGLVPEAVYDADTKGAPRPDSERLYFVARESGK